MSDATIRRFVPPRGGGNPATDDRSAYRWEAVDLLAYKSDASSPFRDVTRQTLFRRDDLAGELRYFEVAPGGHSTLERHAHVHAVLILRGRGRCLVGGTVVTRVNGVEDCAAGAVVVLKKNGSEVARTTADTFGEFRFDRLEPNSGRYEIEVTSGSAGRGSLAFDLGADSPYLGVITLAA